METDRLLENKQNISDYIRLKNSLTPMSETIVNTTTAMKCHPFKNFFVGQFNNPSPQVFDREAGLVANECEVPEEDTVDEPISHCFQYPCSTILPCVVDGGGKNPIEYI